MYQPADANSVGSLRCSDEKEKRSEGAVLLVWCRVVCHHLYLPCGYSTGCEHMAYDNLSPYRVSLSHPESFSHRL